MRVTITCINKTDQGIEKYKEKVLVQKKAAFTVSGEDLN